MHLTVDPSRLETPEARAALNCAASILRAGGLVALPTETVYGLGANALDRTAVEKIFKAKERPAWDPVIVHIAPRETLYDMLDGLIERPEKDSPVWQLMRAFWPGPLTLLLPRAPAVPDVVTAGRPLVGVRMPSHPVALALIRRAGVPVAAPSANRFGHISPTTAAHVLHDLDGRIDAVLDAGPTPRGVESTVLDPTSSPMTIYRPGVVTAEQIRELAGPVELLKGSGGRQTTPAEALPSPGMGMRHYAPRARLVLVEARVEELSARLDQAANGCRGEQIGVMLPASVAAPPGVAAERVYAWGRWDTPEELARGLYAGLRKLDAAGCTIILCPLPPAEGIGAAIRDRLKKAAVRG